MKAIQLTIIALVVGLVATCSVHGQSPGYGGYVPPPGPSQGYDQDRGYDYGGWRSPQSDVGFFYDELAPYGDWVLTQDNGWAWSPRNVHPYWRPYNDGRWVISDYGWTWVSYEPFGWATYHYGRWTFDRRFGWLWVPGTIWGPAWVSWQHGGGYVGWAPLPPSVGFQVGIGIRFGGFDLSFGIRPDSYSFVQERSFLEPRLLSHLLPTARNITIIRSTKNITSYAERDNRVVNRGVDVQRIEKVTGRRVQQLHVVDARAKARTDVGQSELRIFRPQQKQLESVRVGPRVDAGQRAETPTTSPDRAQPADGRRREVPDFVLAPRPGQASRIDPKQLAKQERREQQELKRYLAEEKRKLEKLQQQEISVLRNQAERSQVESNHRAEREALQQQQQIASQQLAVRQQTKRQAAQANPPGRATTRQDKQRHADKQREKDKKR